MPVKYTALGLGLRAVCDTFFGAEIVGCGGRGLVGAEIVTAGCGGRGYRSRIVTAGGVVVGCGGRGCAEQKL